MTRLVAALSLTLLTLAIGACAGAVQETTLDPTSARATNQTRNVGTLSREGFSVNTVNPMTAGLADDQGLDLYGDQPVFMSNMTNGQWAMGWGQNLTADRIVAEWFEPVTDDNGVLWYPPKSVTFEGVAGEGASIVSTSVEGVLGYVEVALALTEAQRAVYLASIAEQGTALRTAIDAALAVATGGVSEIVPDVETPVGPPDTGPPDDPK